VGCWGQASPPVNGSCALAGSLAWGAGGFDATGEHTSEVEAQPTRSGDSKVWLGVFASSNF